MEKPVCKHCQKTIDDLSRCCTDVVVNRHTGDIVSIEYLHDTCVRKYARKNNLSIA